MSAEWMVFLAQVGAEDIDKDTLEAALKFFVDAKLKTPTSDAGVAYTKLEAMPSFPADLPVQAFIARTMQTLNALAPTK